MGARQEDLRAARLLAHVVDIGAHPVAVAKTLARDQLVAAQQRLGAAQLDHDVAVFGPLDDAVDDLADAVLELLELLLALVFAHALDDHLLGGLRGDAAEIDRRQRVDQVAAELDVRVELAGDVQRDLRLVVLDDLDRLGPARQPHVAGALVDRGADVLLVAVFGAAGLLDGLLHGLQHFVALDRLLARDGVGDEQEFGSGDGGIHVVRLLVRHLVAGSGFDQRVRQHQLSTPEVRRRGG